MRVAKAQMQMQSPQSLHGSHTQSKDKHKQPGKSLDLQPQ